MAKLYKRFAKSWKGLDFSEKAKRAFYLYETYGEGDFDVHSIYSPTNNGYAIGKKWLNVTVNMWKEDMVGVDNPSGTLFLWELEEEYPKWFLKSVFKEKYVNRTPIVAIPQKGP